MASAQEAYEQAPPGEQVIGWQLDREQREQLLARWPPRYPRAVADHVTLRSRVAAHATLPAERECLVVGRADDGRGVEAMVVQVAGTSRRPDGGTYHITWSLAEGREARESNQVIAERGFSPVEPPVPVALRPAAYPRSQ